MIVDLADPQRAQGTYPGGQSGDPQSPHYADQIPIWAAGKYLPIYSGSDPQKLPKEAQENKLQFLSH
jgi:acyl-homoserine lactone acylase PvdQ